MNCERCGSELNPNNAWQRVIGWEKRRTGGGTNHVALRQSVQVFMCDSCMRKERAGISAEQGSLI